MYSILTAFLTYLFTFLKLIQIYMFYILFDSAESALQNSTQMSQAKLNLVRIRFLLGAKLRINLFSFSNIVIMYS